MDGWKEEWLRGLSFAASEEELFTGLQGVACLIGFEYFAYGLRLPLPLAQPRTIWFCNCSGHWSERHERSDQVEVDSVARHCFGSIEPFAWSEEQLRGGSHSCDETRRRAPRFGVAMGARSPDGAAGVLSFARGAGAVSEDELSANRGRFRRLANEVHAAMARLVVPRHMPEVHADMTNREREVLRWTAEGKTSYEIARILSLSERTVNFHLNNAVAKLGAANKTHAAVKAVVLGLLR